MRRDERREEGIRRDKIAIRREGMRKETMTYFVFFIVVGEQTDERSSTNIIL